MQLIINIEKKHFVIITLLMSFIGLFMIGNAADVDVNNAWHPLQQIAKSESNMTSVDDNQNDIIDESDKSYSLDATSDVDMNDYFISSLSDPANPQDAATKNYVDSKDAATKNYIDDREQSEDVCIAYHLGGHENHNAPASKCPSGYNRVFAHFGRCDDDWNRYNINGKIYCNGWFELCCK